MQRMHCRVMFQLATYAGCPWHVQALLCVLCAFAVKGEGLALQRALYARSVMAAANKTLVTGAGCGTTIRAVIRRARYRLELRMAAALQETLSPRIPRSAVATYRADAVPAGGFFISRNIVIR